MNMKWLRKFLGLIYKKIVKPILFRFSPDSVHKNLVYFAKLWQSITFLRVLTEWILRFNDKNGVLNQKILGLNFKNPIGLSAGFDKNIELLPTMKMVGFGFQTGGSITLKPKDGNPKPWFYRLPKDSGLVVYAGLANRGYEIVKKNIQQYQRFQKQIPLNVSVAVVNQGKNDSDQKIISNTVTLIKKLNKDRACQMIEINISCPNARDNQPFTNPKALEDLLNAIDKGKFQIPMFVKMPIKPWTEFQELLNVILRHNIKGVTISNLVKDRNLVQIKSDLPDSVKGGISGKLTQKFSDDLIKKTYQKCGDKLLIIGAGGVFSAEDAYRKIKNGASLVALITGMIFEGPTLIGDINQELAELVQADGYKNVTEAIGYSIDKKA